MAGVLQYYNGTYLVDLGEIQTDFNMSFVLDGTKDSCRVQVLSFDKEYLPPYTICYMEELNSWWIVAKDKVERHANDSGFFYVHNLNLLGAIELLNARDLTDIAFYQNRYTIAEFVQRLFDMSNFEFEMMYDYQSNIDSTTLIDYIKTYENYTLLSALRDFFNGYNCDVKLEFYKILSAGHYYLPKAKLVVCSKTGNVNQDILLMSSFKDVRETRTIDKNSYGTTVVSNVDNATASKMQVYPTFGGVRLVSDSYVLDKEHAYVKLPSNLNDIEWVKMYLQCMILVKESDDDVVLLKSFYSFDKTNVESIISLLDTKISTSYPYLETEWEQKREELKTYLNEIGVCTFKKGININAYNGNYENPNNLVIPEIHNNTTQQNLILTESEVKQALVKPTDGIGYTKGSNKIDIDFLGRTNNGWFTTASKSCDCGYYTKSFTLGSGDGALSFSLGCGTGSTYLVSAKNLLFAVKYEPMSDLKVKVDNELETNDIQIYNQNGKLTDGVAFSKMLNSYSREITTDNITRYNQYRGTDYLPKVGQLVNDNGTIYVINNISYNFYLSEQHPTYSGDLPYMVDCEISMSKQVAVKSLMTNPNSNIRDYGIPQKHTIKRKQLYRDYCELNFDSDLTQNDCYMGLDYALQLTPMQDDREMVKAGIEVEFASGSKYYYQLDTTRYIFKKMLITMVDFQDNNIIGYDFQNQFSGFDVTKVLSVDGMNNDTSIPIQYTDNNGCVEKFTLLFQTSEQYNTAIDTYCDTNSGSEYKYVLTSRCFINLAIYSEMLYAGYVMRIVEDEYKKDPLEIPVFEHTFQFGTTPEVIIGDGIFALQKPNYWNLYAFEYIDSNKANENNALAYSTHNITRRTITIGGHEFPTSCYYENACHLAWASVQGNTKRKELRISLYQNFDTEVQDSYYNPVSSIITGKDLAIYRYEYNILTNTTIKSLMMIVHLPTNPPLQNYYTFKLYAHQWKLK